MARQGVVRAKPDLNKSWLIWRVFSSSSTIRLMINIAATQKCFVTPVELTRTISAIPEVGYIGLDESLNYASPTKRRTGGCGKYEVLE